MAAENKLDARQESAAYQAELDSSLGRFGIVTRKRLVSGASGFRCRSSEWAGIRKNSPGASLMLPQLSFPARQQTMANCPNGAASRASSRLHFRISNKLLLISNSPSDSIELLKRQLSSTPGAVVTIHHQDGHGLDSLAAKKLTDPTCNESRRVAMESMASTETDSR